MAEDSGPPGAGGRTLASGGEAIRLWGMDVDQAIQRICAITTNTLTPATWERYVSPHVPYRPPTRDAGPEMAPLSAVLWMTIA